MRSNEFESDQESSVPADRILQLQDKYPDLFDKDGKITRGAAKIDPDDEPDIAKLMQKTHTYVNPTGKYEPMREERLPRKPTPDEIEQAKSMGEN